MANDDSTPASNQGGVPGLPPEETERLLENIRKLPLEGGMSHRVSDEDLSSRDGEGDEGEYSERGDTRGDLDDAGGGRESPQPAPSAPRYDAPREGRFGRFFDRLSGNRRVMGWGLVAGLALVLTGAGLSFRSCSGKNNADNNYLNAEATVPATAPATRPAGALRDFDFDDSVARVSEAAKAAAERARGYAGASAAKAREWAGEAGRYAGTIPSRVGKLVGENLPSRGYAPAAKRPVSGGDTSKSINAGTANCPRYPTQEKLGNGGDKNYIP